MTVERDVAGMAILEKSGSLISALEELGEASVQELASRAAEPVSSTYRLIAALIDLGWVDKGSRRGLFRLGVRFVRIGSRLEDQVDVREASKPSLRTLRAQTGSTAFLCFARGDWAVCVERLSGRDVQSLAMRIGDALPLFRGAAPMAILAHLPASEQEAVLQRFDSRRSAGEDIPTASTLRRRIREIRDAGFAVSDGDVTIGIAAIGAPVFNHRGELEAAISVSGLRARILEEGLGVAALTVQAALDASLALGYEPETTASAVR